MSSSGTLAGRVAVDSSGAAIFHFTLVKLYTMKIATPTTMATSSLDIPAKFFEGLRTELLTVFFTSWLGLTVFFNGITLATDLLENSA